MIRLGGTGSTVANLEVHASSIAANCVAAVNVELPFVSYCWLHSTKNNYTTTAYRPDIIIMSGCTRVRIYDSLIQDCGYPKASGSASVNYYGNCIYLINCGGDAVNVIGCIIRDSLHAGIGLAGTVNLTIQDNEIAYTGLNYTYGCSAIADGITGYHQGTGDLNLVWKIWYNYIHHSYNHGIHVSGRGISITGNNIQNQFLTSSGIYLGDQYNTDCTKDCWLGSNTVGCFNNNAGTVVHAYKSGSIHVSNDHSCHGIDWQGPLCN
jgi:hypothetical protein